MITRKLVVILAVLLSWQVGFGQVDLINKVKDNQSENAKEGFQFEPIVDVEVTSVKNQGASGTCWSYCTSSFLESEMQRLGKEPIDLAEMFTVRNVYQEKSERYVRMHGNLNFGQGGALPDAIDMYRNYGMVPQEVYAGLNYGEEINRHGEMEAVLKGMLDAVIANKNKKLSPVWKDAVSSVLDVYLGAYPDEFEFRGKSYTPQSFAAEFVGINPGNYIQITSWTHQPFYKPMVLMVPDNWNYGQSYNVQMEDLTTIIDHALKNGYTISWAADVSEKYFSWKNGIAYVPEKDYRDMTTEERDNMFNGPKPELMITQEMRQEGYENYTTTDDHGMHIVGLYQDQTGKEWYRVKNSWGEGNDHEGYLYVSKPFVQYKTISFLLNKEGVPASIINKLSL